eukprot:RCo052509
MKRCGKLLAKCPGRCCGIPAEGEAATRGCVQIPLWLLVGLLSVVSLVVIGIVTYFLVYIRTGQAMDSVAVSYREVGFQAVENKVIGMLGQVAMMTKSLGQQAPVPGDVLPVELRRQVFLGITSLPIALDFFVGFSTGETLGMHRDPATNVLNWQLSNNLTGYRLGKMWVPPAAVDAGNCSSCWGSDLMSTVNNLTITGNRYNGTTRGWYTTAVQNPTRDVFFGALYFTLGVQLTVPAQYWARPQPDGSTASYVAVTNVGLQAFDDFLKTIAADLLPESVIFLVERKTGALLGSSVSGQNLFRSYDPVTGTAQVVPAQQATNDVIRGIATTAVDPVTGWMRFAGNHNEDIQTGDYYAHVGAIGMQGLDWVLVVGTKRSVWMAYINSGVPLTVGLVAACIVGLCLVVLLLVRLSTSPLLRIITQLSLLQELDLEQVKPFRRLSALSEVATLMLAFNGLAAALKEYRKFMPESLFTKDTEDSEPGTPGPRGAEAEKPRTSVAQNKKKSLHGGSTSGEDLLESCGSGSETIAKVVAASTRRTTSVPRSPRSSSAGRYSVSTVDFNSRRLATVASVDLSGFETFAARPDELQHWHHRYLTVVQDSVNTNKGMVDKVLGDRVLCLWNVPRKCARSEYFAVKAGLTMTSRWASITAELKAPELKMRVGIASSVVTFGNFGSDTMKVFIVVGDAVEVAVALQRVGCKETGVRILGT